MSSDRTSGRLFWLFVCIRITRQEMEYALHSLTMRYGMFVYSEDMSNDVKKQLCGKVWDSIKFMNCVESLRYEDMVL